ncbi:MAG: hypothetical protein M3407_00790 [Acidobacteriota bacterium]|nr:hypothetical protein [Acidobacteriota bacterium]
MGQKFRVSFNSPQSGFMSVGLRAGEQEFVAAVAHKPYDSLRDLLVALTALLTSDGEQVVKWNCEPDELDFNLTVDDERVRLDVVHYLNHRRSRRTSQQVFTVAGAKLDICGAFWKALRELHRDIETDDFAGNWRREFPETEMQELTKTFRDYKHKAGTQPIDAKT